MKIVVLDGYAENPGDLSWAPLEALGEVTVYDRTSLTDEKETIVRLSGAEIAVTNKTPITRRVIDACPRLRYITMLATGYNVVDAAYAPPITATLSTPESGPPARTGATGTIL